ncbi:MAG: hypothetical protein K8T90_08810 [Planctomycetes bacterium]|nr:hypothetical protein [Planctomycetota bacterium]
MSNTSKLVTFRNDDAGYRRWRRAHPRGYVLNLFGGADARENVLHRASCDDLTPKLINQSTTSVPKVCSDDRTAIDAEADQLRGGRDRWTICDHCFRWA